MNLRPAILNGCIAGILTVGIFLLCYFADRTLVLRPWLWWASLIIYVVFMFRAVQQTDSPDFRSSVRAAFLVFIVANALFYLFYYLLFRIFDPGLVDLQRQMLADHPLWPADNTTADLSVTIGQILFNFAYTSIGGFVLALIVSGAGRR